MLSCVPVSLCSWDFEIRGISGTVGTVKFRWMSEEGSISSAGNSLRVVKHGFASGRWTLEKDETVVAEGEKESAFFREYVIRYGGQRLVLRPATAFTRRFDILRGDGVMGSIEPVHAFTRRAVIRCTEDVPEAVQFFCFWLTVLAWRRSSKN
jgi:hypothetical protein